MIMVKDKMNLSLGNAKLVILYTLTITKVVKNAGLLNH